MVQKTLLENLIGAWGTATPGVSFTRGWRFTTTDAGYVVALRFYRPDAVSTSKPTNLRLWRVSDQALLADVTPDDNGLIGWQDTYLGSPILLVNGTEYCVSQFFPANVTCAQMGSGNFSNYPSPLSGFNPHRRLIVGSNAFPSNTDNNDKPAVDIIWSDEPTGGEGVPTTEAGIENAMVRWLSADADNTRQEHLPWLTHALATAINESTEETLELVEALGSTVEAIAWGNPAAVLTSIPQVLKAIWTDSSAGVPRMETAILGGIDSAETAILAAVGAIEPGGGTCHFPMTVGGADWTQVGQTTGTGGSEWEQEADAYVFHLESASEALRSAEGVGTELIYWLRGWAMPWDGTNIYPNRVNFVGPDAVIVSGTRWPGILMQVPPDVEWTLTAYNYTP